MKKYITVIHLLLIPACIYFLVQAFYKYGEMFIEVESNVITDYSPEESSLDEENHPITYYQSIMDRDLFKTARSEIAEAKQPEAVDIEALKQTELKLKLWGTVSGDIGREYAVIEDLKNREQNLYRVGESIQIALVKQILRGKVILNVNGQDEILEMEMEERPLATAAPGDPKAQAAAPQEESPGQIKLERSEIQDAIQNVNNLMRQARIRPHFSNGKPDGLTLTSISPDSIFTKLGLRTGDIIVGVDGSKIQSVDDALKFYNNLKNSSSVKLEIKRRGQTQTIDYDIQ